ncbi:MAG: phosphoenolpyruvate-dependent sugar phosphotransferase system EIIA 2 [Ardenticatenia bacterium]|nr:MAG: phosphoenolpyruvate-dependent sugar phosphotransferase system EIIA 2 [Ardenticatenia bacterium]
MAILTAERIQLHAAPQSKEEAIRLVGELLVRDGCVAPEYVEGMLAREKIMSTYLGNGVAIPHGQFENREHIYRSGISVVQVPQGVEWEPGEKAYLIVGIAATSDEHVAVLANLAEAIEDESVVQEMVQTDDPEVILRILNAEPQDV